MSVFTKHWKHRDFSPSRLNADDDLHTDGVMIIIARGGDQRPDKETPQHIGECAAVTDTKQAIDVTGFIEVGEFMARLREPRRHRSVGHRVVTIQDHSFDALMLWKFCIAVLGTGPIGWSIHEYADGTVALRLFGDGWRGCVMGVKGGTGPQVLP